MQNILDQYINGNLTAAKSLARRVPWRSLYAFLRDEAGMEDNEARAVADYLKGKGSFQAACDAAIGKAVQS